MNKVKIFLMLFSVSALLLTSGWQCGVNNPPDRVTGKNTWTGNSNNVAAEDLSRQAANQAQGETGDRYTDAVELPEVDEFVTNVKKTVKPVLEDSFGAVKLTGYVNLSLNGVDDKSSGSAVFTSKKQLSVTDMAELIKNLKKDGYAIVASVADGPNINVAAQKGQINLTVTYQANGQDINISLMLAPSY